MFEFKQSYYSLNNNKRINNIPTKNSIPRLETYIAKFGTVQIATSLRYNNSAIIICGNGGRPGGALGNCDGTMSNIHLYYETQEESILSNVVYNYYLLNFKSYRFNHHDFQKSADLFYRRTIWKKWGMKNPNASDFETLQGVDYTSSDCNHGHSWLLKNVNISNEYITKFRGKFEKRCDSTNLCNVGLIFVPGPNCGSIGKNNNSTCRRTFNNHVLCDYELFKKLIIQALFSALCTAIENGYTTIYLGLISCGIYAGPHKGNIRKDYTSLINYVLNIKILAINNNYYRIGEYFEHIVLGFKK